MWLLKIQRKKKKYETRQVRPEWSKNKFRHCYPSLFFIVWKIQKKWCAIKLNIWKTVRKSGKPVLVNVIISFFENGQFFFLRRTDIVVKWWMVGWRKTQQYAPINENEKWWILITKQKEVYIYQSVRIYECWNGSTHKCKSTAFLNKIYMYKLNNKQR